MTIGTGGVCGGPVGSGKTALMDTLCKTMRDRRNVAAIITDDIYTRENAEFLTCLDLLVINKIDLAPLVGASLEVMNRDARRMRGDRPFVFTNLRMPRGDRIFASR